MVIFFEHGRLGNQLFQYCGLRALLPKEKIIFVGFTDLNEFVEQNSLDNCHILPLKNKLAHYALRKALDLLSQLRLVAKYEELNTSLVYKLYKKWGLINFISVIFKADFQHPYVTNRITRDSVKIKCEIVKKAQKFLKTIIDNDNSKEFVFIHVRRGDYVQWPHEKYPAVLPYAWYRNCIDEIRSIVRNPLFIIMSDDMPYVADLFSDECDFVFSRNSSLLELAIMTNCKHGILSSSSFSWWGAYLALERGSFTTSNPNYFLAPKEWCDSGGSKLGINYPTLICDWMITRSRWLEKN